MESSVSDVNLSPSPALATCNNAKDCCFKQKTPSFQTAHSAQLGSAIRVAIFS
jgi:hypothetical protein